MTSLASLARAVASFGFIVPVLVLNASRAAGGEDSASNPPRFSGVYPHLAAMSTSYSEAGIGAVVPWADRLWYVSYVAHKGGAGVGLFEIKPDLTIRRRPESIVGTHAGRMIHRESNQLIIGPYAIDAQGNVRVFQGLTDERVTAVMRHLTDPARKIYFMAMEGNLYEADVYTLESRLLFDLRKELDIRSGVHFKGGYTAQGRVVVANNSYFAADQQRGTGDGRLAQWDGRSWTVLHRTAFCDVTTAAGVNAVPDDKGPLWATGWDRRSVLLAVLTNGTWTTYRLPKASQSYDQAWCTEWPRIREVAPGVLMMDMHGLYYEMSPEFKAGGAGGLLPIAAHLKMTPDFCVWQGKLVMAGDENSSMGHRHRTGGQPQSNLWFGSLAEVRRWGVPAGWGGPWLNDEVHAGVPSEPMFVKGFKRRVLHLWQPAKAMELVGLSRCTGQFEVVDLPEALAGLPFITLDRGSMMKPAPGFRFDANKDVTVYMAVQDRGSPHLPEDWKKTNMALQWRHGGQLYSDTVYQRQFLKGTVEIPGHDGQDERKAYGVPHLCFVREALPGGEPLQIGNLPQGLGAQVGAANPILTSATTAFRIEVDHDGRGTWRPYATVEVPPGGYAWKILPEDLEACWVRIVPSRDTVAGAQFYFGPCYDRTGSVQPEGLFESLPTVGQNVARSQGAVLPFADRLWLESSVSDAAGHTEGRGLYEIGKDVRFVRRSESIGGVFANRLMVSGLLSIGPHLISDAGHVRTLQGLEGQHVAACTRHPRPGKMYLLTVDGRLLEADLETRGVSHVADVAEALDVKQAGLRFKAAHLAGATLIVAACAPDGASGCLAECSSGNWKIIDRAAFAEVMNLGSMSEEVIALGWDQASAILKAKAGEGRWNTFRLPKASGMVGGRACDQWPRVREVVTERMLANLCGLFYEVSALTYAWSIRPVAAHRRDISDFCSWRGLLVTTGNSTAAAPSSNYVRAAQDVGLWLGTVDDLWKFDAPAGEGGPWRDSHVEPDQPSDPYLMANFDNKRVELSHDADVAVTFTLQVDPTVQRRLWQEYAKIRVEPRTKQVHEFPRGFCAHWVRLKADHTCRATAWFRYE